jgi:hypothetical protein
MSEHTPETYTFRCVFEKNLEAPFIVRVKTTAYFYDVNKAIAREMPNALEGVAPMDLDLHQVDVKGSTMESIYDAIKKKISELGEEEPFDNADTLSDIYASPSAQGDIHLIVRIHHQGNYT